jgi:hypothetical protein
VEKSKRITCFDPVLENMSLSVDGQLRLSNESKQHSVLGRWYDCRGGAESRTGGSNGLGYEGWRPLSDMVAVAPQSQITVRWPVFDKGLQPKDLRWVMTATDPSPLNGGGMSWALEEARFAGFDGSSRFPNFVHKQPASQKETISIQILSSDHSSSSRVGGAGGGGGGCPCKSGAEWRPYDLGGGLSATGTTDARWHDPLHSNVQNGLGLRSQEQQHQRSGGLDPKRTVYIQSQNYGPGYLFGRWYSGASYRALSLPIQLGWISPGQQVELERPSFPLFGDEPPAILAISPQSALLLKLGDALSKEQAGENQNTGSDSDFVLFQRVDLFALPAYWSLTRLNFRLAWELRAINKPATDAKRAPFERPPPPKSAPGETLIQYRLNRIRQVVQQEVAEHYHYVISSDWNAYAKFVKQRVDMQLERQYPNIDFNLMPISQMNAALWWDMSVREYMYDVVGMYSLYFGYIQSLVKDVVLDILGPNKMKITRRQFDPKSVYPLAYYWQDWAQAWDAEVRKDPGFVPNLKARFMNSFPRAATVHELLNIFQDYMVRYNKITSKQSFEQLYSS